jgi:hypothetical protein
MSKIVFHPAYHSRIDAAIDAVVGSIHRAKLEEKVAALGEAGVVETVIEAVKEELTQPKAGFDFVLRRLRASAA